MIKRSNSETNSNTSFRAKEALDQQQAHDIEQSFYKQKTSPERSKKSSKINSSFVEYLIRDIDNKEGINKILSQDGSVGNKEKRIIQKEQLPSRKREIRAESANSYNQNNKEIDRNGNNNQWNINGMSNLNSNQNQTHQSIEKKQEQNAYMNGKCVYKIFPNIQLKLPMISQNNNNNSHTYQNIQNQNNSVNINSAIRPYQLGYSIDHNYYPQHVVGHRQGIKTQQSPRGQISPYQNNNSQCQNTNNHSYITKKYIDKSFEEIVGRVNTEMSQAGKVKSKSITESNNDPHYSASKSINGLINQTEISDLQPQNAFFQQNFSNHKSVNSQNYKRKILLKLKSSQQTKNNYQNTQSSNYTEQSSSGIASSYLNNQNDQQKQRLQQDRLINYISCKFNQIDKNLNNKLSKDEIIQFFECHSGSPIQSYKDFEIFIKNNFSMFLLELVQKETEKAGFLNFREFKQLLQDFFMKNIQALENKAVLAIKPVQNSVNLKNNPDQSISLFQKKRETSSELKNNNQPQFKLSDKRIYSAQKARDQENEELLAIRQRDNSFDNAVQRQVNSQNQSQLQKQQKIQQQNVQNKEKKLLKYDLFQQQKKYNFENQINSNKQLNQSYNYPNQQHQNNSTNVQIDQISSGAKNQIQKNQASNQKYYLGSYNASRIPSQNQINNSSFSNSCSENDFQSPKKLNKLYQSQNKQKMLQDQQQSNQKSQVKQTETNKNTNSEIDIDKNSLNNQSNIIFRTEQKVRSKSTIRNQSSQSARKVLQNEKIQTSENSQNSLSYNKQFRSNSQQSNYSFDSPINNQLPQFHLKLQKSKFSNESPTQKPQNNRYQQTNENNEESEQYVKFIELHQIPINADSKLNSQQQSNTQPTEQQKIVKQEIIVQKARSNSRNIQNPKNSPPNDNNRLRSLSKESQSSKQSTQTIKAKLAQNDVIYNQENKQLSQQKKPNQQQTTEFIVDIKQISNSVSVADQNQLAKEQKQQPNINQENTKSSSFTEKSINYVSEVSNPKYYFSSTQQMSDDHSDFKLAFEDQKLNKIIDLQKQPFAPSQKNAIVGMSGSLLLRQYNKCLKVNSPQKKTTLTLHQSNPIIEQNEPSLTEPNEQTLTERQLNLEATKILSPNPVKRKEFECTFRPQSLDNEFKETEQLNILQTDSQPTNFNKFQHKSNNHLKVQTFCASPSNSIMETPQYHQLKILDINKTTENQQPENKNTALSLPIKVDSYEIKEDNNYSFAQNLPQKNEKSGEDSSKKLGTQQILREAQDQNDQNIEKASSVILNIKEDIINLSNNFKAESINKNRAQTEVKSGSKNKEQKSKKPENKFEETKIQSMNQIQYQEDDTRKSSATKKQIKSTFSQQFNSTFSDKTQVLNNHLDQNCQNFLHKKEVKVLKKPSMKKSSEIAIRQTQNEDNDELQQAQTENQIKNEETAKFEEHQKILNDITFENNSQMINAENNRKSSIQQGDLKLFYPQNSLSNSQNL
ncbi:hypothetical protein TTHERM_00656110 (macronuclear) [Tetrahymena thermophila SB210]|uniref:Uncharacterized protein n=1 Tax=Tetrahymena thermophila (strain SB210) TaxID=312017 RepID=Q22GU5_TETTS|nr:hypothetical protein TTHERM_00656110 [Tetrahymena thermophila SB210]EAR84579.1 hypothetical protein TTHERM_00656110 [Tetrahymena thermophila SB210]|eukprot:XP_001032242.1 hypothetical protein TTHERM_00656110 [Tetrahymena thermophila SB210]